MRDEGFVNGSLPNLGKLVGECLLGVENAEMDGGTPKSGAVQKIQEPQRMGGKKIKVGESNSTGLSEEFQLQRSRGAAGESAKW